jgi:regulator of sigma D
VTEMNSIATHTSANNLHLVAALQEERSAVWTLYCQIAEMKPFSSENAIRPMLSEFSQLLIDYISFGHFSIYEHLIAEKQHQISTLSYAEQMYPAFSNTTESAITFSDTYDDGKRKFNTENLAQDLSVLGERLAERMELEDRLCSMLLH